MAITVPVVNTALSVSAFGKPVADQLNSIAPTAWTDLTLSNGWSNVVGSRPNTGWKTQGGFGILRIAMKGGTSGLACFTLPAAARPTYYIDSQIRCGPGMGWINFDSTGSTVLFVANGGDNTLAAGLIVYPLT